MRRFEGTSRRLLLAGSVGAVALLGGHAAFAADGGAAGAGPTSIEEVVVTAEKRSVNIQQVPASVSAISGDKLQDLGLKNLQDYSKYVPGLIINQGGSPGQTSVTLRGIAAVGPGSLVGYYIDDAPLGSSSNYARATAFALDLLPYDLERLEVLRGPQGTLYGAGAMGGLLKYVLKQADTNTFSAQVGAETSYTDHSDGAGYAVRGMVNIPLASDKLGIRLSAFDQGDQGYVDNVRLGLSDVNDSHQYGGRAALTFKPVENLRINLNAMWYRLKSDDNNTVRLGNIQTHNDPGGAVVYTGDTSTYGPYGQSYAFRQPFTKNIDYYSGTINWDVGGLTAVSATTWSKTHTHQVQDATDVYGAYTQLFGLAPGVGRFNLGLDLDKFTQEFRLVSPTGGKVEWMAGAFYTHEKSANHQLAEVFHADYTPITEPGIAPYFNPFFAFAELPTTYSEYAAFGDVTVNFSPKFDVTGGIRYAHNSQDFAQISDGLILGGPSNFPGESAESVWTWQANARYHFTPDVMLYARIATGYRPGGPNASLTGLPVPPVGSDTLTSYEGGLKSTFMGGRMLLNLTAFNIEWKDIQLTVVDTVHGTSALANAGDAYSRGFELEGAFYPVEGLRLGYDAAYTKAQLTKLILGAPPFLLGYQLPGVPKWSAGLTADYEWGVRGDWKANVGAGLRYLGETWVFAPSVLGYIPNTKTPAYTTLDLRAGLSNDRFTINLFARNVTDKRVYLGQAPVQDPFDTNPLTSTHAIDATMLQPRVIGISVDAKF